MRDPPHSYWMAFKASRVHEVSQTQSHTPRIDRPLVACPLHSSWLDVRGLMAPKAKASPSGKLCPCDGTCGFALCCRFQALGRKRARTPGQRDVAKHGAGPDHPNGECAACSGEPDRARRKVPPAPVAGAVVAALAGGALAGGAVAAAAAKALPAKAGPNPKHPGKAKAKHPGKAKAKAKVVPVAGPHAAAGVAPPVAPAPAMGPAAAPAAGPGLFAAAAAPGPVPMAPPAGPPGPLNRFVDLAPSSASASDLSSEISVVLGPPGDAAETDAADAADSAPAPPGVPPVGSGSGAKPELDPDAGQAGRAEGDSSGLETAEPPRGVLPVCLAPVVACTEEKDPKAMLDRINALADARGRPRALVHALVNGLLALRTPTREVRWGKKRGEWLNTRRAQVPTEETEDREKAWVGGASCTEAAGPSLNVTTVVHTIARLVRHWHLDRTQIVQGKPVDALRQRFADELGALWSALP